MATYEVHVIGNVIENFVIVIGKSITCTGICKTDNCLCALCITEVHVWFSCSCINNMKNVRL